MARTRCTVEGDPKGRRTNWRACGPLLLAFALLAEGLIAPLSFAQGTRRMRSGLKDTQSAGQKVKAELRENRTISRETEQQLAVVAGKVEEVGSALERTEGELRSEKVHQKTLAGQVGEARAQVAKRKRMASKRLAEIYMQSSMPPTMVLLSAKNLGELSTRRELLGFIAERDREIFDGLRRWTATLESKRRASQESVAKIGRLAQRQSEYKRGLAGAQAAKTQLLTKLEARQGELETALRQFEEDALRIEAEIAAYEARRREEARRRAEARRRELERQRAEAARRAREAGKKPPIIRQLPPEERDPVDHAPSALGRPSSGPITSRFGRRFHPILKVWRNHDGIDFGAPIGAPISAAADGVVITATTMSGYGRVIIVDHGGGIATVYGHCSAIAVSAGQSVSRGQRIGSVGTSGLSTGPHLHFEVRLRGRKVDPMGYLR